MLHKKSSPKTICFRRWTRKNYAVFNSLGKQIKIGVLGLTLSLVSMSVEQVTAQNKQMQSTARESESEAIPIDEVLITTTKTLSTAEPARVVSTISRAEIAQLPAQDLPKLLEYLASVDLRQRGAGNVQADVSIRGGSYDQVLILLNGVNISDPQTGHYNLDLPINLQNIDRIEILQGPGSRAMAPGAFAGAINIVTGSNERSSAQASITGGSNGYFAPNAGISYANSTPNHTLQVLGTAALSKSNGYTTNTDFNLVNTFAQARYKSNKIGNFNLQAGYQYKAYGANGFYSLTYPNQFENTRTIFTSLDYLKTLPKITIQGTAYYRYHFDKFELFRSNPPAWYTTHNYHQTDVLGGCALLNFKSILGTTRVGSELRGEHIYSNVLGEPMANSIHVKGEADNTFYTHQKQRNIVSWFAEQVYFHQKFSASVGVQGSYSNDFGHYTCINADAVIPVTEHVQLNMSIGQTLRLPTFTDLYYRSATHISNPSLKPEQATSYEVGLKYLSGALRVQGSAFFRHGKNIIDWVRSSDTTKWQSQNHISLNTLGTELNATYTPHGSLQRFVKSLRLSYTYLHMSKDSQGLYSSNALDYLQHKAALTGVHSLPLHFELAWSAMYEQRAGQYTDFTTKEVKNFPSVALVDTKLAWRRQWLLLYLECSNVFNTQYFDYANLVQPGRWIKVGIEVKIER